MSNMETVAGGVDWRSPLGLGRLLSRYTLSPPATIGDASAALVIMALLNNSADKRLVIPRCHAGLDNSAASTVIGGNVRLYRQAAPLALTGGNALNKALKDNRFTSDALVTALAAAPNDRGALTLITGTAGTTPNGVNCMGSASFGAMHTLVGQRTTTEAELVLSTSPPVINPGEGAVVVFQGPAGVNLATTLYSVSMDVEEYGP